MHALFVSIFALDLASKQKGSQLVLLLRLFSAVYAFGSLLSSRRAPQTSAYYI